MTIDVEAKAQTLAVLRLRSHLEQRQRSCDADQG